MERASSGLSMLIPTLPCGGEGEEVEREGGGEERKELEEGERL